MIASSWWKVGLGVVGVTAAFATAAVGCGSDTGTASTSTSTSSGGGSTSASTSGEGGATGTGGAMGTGGATGTGGAMGTGGDASTSSSTGSGMMNNYADCQECTDLSMGAPSSECKSGYDACAGDPNCMTIYNCVNDEFAGCSTDATGACCTFDCYDALKASLASDPNGAAAAQKAIDEYHAYDDCLFCNTCKTLCTADAYCTAYAAGQAACVP